VKDKVTLSGLPG